MIRSGEVTSSYDIEAKGIMSRKAADRAIHTACLSPLIVHQILAGELPEISVDKLLAVKSLLWADQHAALGV